MKVVVDTNIIFSALLNTSSSIAGFLLTTTPFEFFAPSYLQTELSKHQEKLMKLHGSISIEEFVELRFLVTRKINFISEYQIEQEYWQKAHDLTAKVDNDDAAFVALALQLNASLWTGDKRLIHGIQSKGFTPVLTTEDMRELRRELEGRP
ncbi:MAG: PIN domain-containing protein [Bacteroidota bacterium]